MPAKEFVLDTIGPVKVYKRKGARTIRLSIVGDGTIRVTQPRWLPYKAGVEFAQSRKAWINENAKPKEQLYNMQLIGKSYELYFISEVNIPKPRSRLIGKQIVVKLPIGVEIHADKSQKVARMAVERALKIDTETLLIPRLQSLAREHGFTFRSVSVKKLKSRWGSCSQNKDITLSSFLVQLPWNLIDYVLLHELQHTTVLAHGKKFWDALEHHVYDLPQTRKAIKNFQARIQ